MSADDPFAEFERDRTVIKPSAGRAGRAAPGPAADGAPPAPAAAAPMHTGGAGEGPELPVPAGLSPLMQAAAPLLSTGAWLRTQPHHPDVPGLRTALMNSLTQFEARLRAAGQPNDHVVASKYVLAASLDEAASTTPWGGSGRWIAMHGDNRGGEKVFDLLAALAKDVPANRPVLELLNATLALGFRGRYAVATNGSTTLDSVRTRLTEMLRQNAGALNPDLSPHWQGAAPPARRLGDGIPLWVVGAALAALALVVYGVLNFSLHGRSDATFQALQALDVRAPAQAAAPVPAPQPRLAGLLKAQIDAGELKVTDLADRSVVTLAGDGLFEPGSAELTTKVRPVIAKVAEAMNKLPGQIIITGHSDSQPIRSLRFPSNWHLSTARAESVRDLLAATVKPERLKAEGRADSEPVADNATATGRAQNRRVEISLAASAGTE